jgi:tetratricopeptide (TPR) repeat protein
MIGAAVVAVFLIVLPSRPIAALDQTGRAQVSFEQLSREADRARDENRNDDAIRLYKSALVKRPDWEQGLWFLATLLYEKEQYPDARDILRQFMTLRPDAGPGWALLGMSEFQTREYSRALDHLQRAMAAGMGDRQELAQSVFYDASVLLTRFERYDDSMEMLVRMLASEPQSSVLTEPAGLGGLRLPLLPAEIPADRRELVHMAGDAIVASQTQHYEDADTKFKQLVASYPQEPGVHFLYGAYLMQLHPDDGIREMKLELQNSPSHVLARVRLAEQYLAQEQNDEALQLAEEAEKLDPKRASPHMLAGEALQAKGDLAAALKEFETSRDDDSLNTRIHWDLMRAYNAAGRTNDAKREKDEIEKLSRSESNSGSPRGSRSE